jgi:hypothetical protein
VSPSNSTVTGTVASSFNGWSTDSMVQAAFPPSSVVPVQACRSSPRPSASDTRRPETAAPSVDSSVSTPDSLAGVPLAIRFGPAYFNAVSCRVIVNGTVSLLGFSPEPPANRTVSDVDPGACAGVSLHFASPDPFVVAPQCCDPPPLPSVKLSLAPDTAPDPPVNRAEAGNES